jgi:hypothetical protein
MSDLKEKLAEKLVIIQFKTLFNHDYFSIFKKSRNTFELSRTMTHD